MKSLRAPKKIQLSKIDPADTFGIKDKETAKKQLEKLQTDLRDLQEVLYAQSQHAVLMVLQAIDTGGKDGTIRKVFSAINPQGVKVSSFKAPSSVELAHDYLWRIHREVPARGMIGIFNRSHYEDVLVVQVHDIITKAEAKRRYQQINDFERMLEENRIHLLKIFLHISKDEQKERLESRLADTTKHWKFDPSDLAERKLWDRYENVFEDAFEATNTKWAPWHLVPANHKWSRDVAVATLLKNTLQGLDLEYPKPNPDIAKGIKVI